MSTVKWNTDKVCEAIQSMSEATIGRVSIHRNGQGGDCDSENLVVSAENCEERFFVCGFNTNADITTPDDCEVEMVEVKDGRDSRGGFTGDDENSAVLYTRLKKTLVGLGFAVVENLDHYF